MLRISTVNNHERMSTQKLLQIIARAVEEGETDFHISASGQHDIGGPLWNREGKTLHFTVSNPGQRLGSMCLPGTVIKVDGPAPADVGWLNTGGVISICGDAGDTAGHCAAGGRIYIGGRAGARSGSLMKHDPEHAAPELWILNSTGSFSFEFMGGGSAVICGHDSQTLPSVLGERPCVGMVGGAVFFRGPHGELPKDVIKLPLNEADIAWLKEGLPKFLEAVGKHRLLPEFTIWSHWAKLLPAASRQEHSTESIADFRKNSWFAGGLFGDVLSDNLEVAPLVPHAENRLKYPVRINAEQCSDCMLCLEICPQAAIKRKKNERNEAAEYAVNSAKCIGCGFCSLICPRRLWSMESQD